MASDHASPKQIIWGCPYSPDDHQLLQRHTSQSLKLVEKEAEEDKDIKIPSKYATLDHHLHMSYQTIIYICHISLSSTYVISDHHLHMSYITFKTYHIEPASNHLKSDHM